jgi:hypothetical protein
MKMSLSPLAKLAIGLGALGLLFSTSTAFAGQERVPSHDAPIAALNAAKPASAGGAQVASAKSALPTTIRRARANGATVDMGWADDLSQTFLLVATDSANPGVALMQYNRVAYDPTSNVCTTDPVLGVYCHLSRVTYEAGSGYINTNDVRIGANTAELTTSFASATNVYFNTCVADDVAGTSDCTTTIPPGQITLQWQKTNTDYYKYSGVTETKVGPEITRVTGTKQQYSAKTDGSILGVPVVHQPGNIGSQSSATIDIIRTR